MLLSIIKCLAILLYILTVCITISKCYNVKNIQTYRKLSIEDEKLCSPITKRKIELEQSDYLALIVSQTRTKDHHARWSKHLLCKFHVDASTYGGLFVVVQNLNFRRNETTGECIDYIKFQRKDSDSKRICGKFHVSNTVFNKDIDQPLVAEGQVSFDGKVDTEIFINRDKLDYGQIMDMQIIYTAFRRCDKLNSTLPCLPGSPHFCINPIYFNDSIVNCPFQGCQDEGSCSLVKTDNNNNNEILFKDDDNMNTKIILSAVTSLIVSFVCVIIVIWLCKKMGKVCWAINSTESNRSASRTQTRVIELQNRSETEVTSGANTPPSAPEFDKDLPPSYESLFPQR